ncbi:ATP-binding protein [Coraliomargarita sp. SDUM461003]|uniref:histidine kinase n=1 Tax=Thalassobacterium maritimum TaxID=3041265 RepID=A0ABU1ARP7_9BACT|nr:ATP-binding protein [Coraliomargarita sp. SDUM461003]MDQ8206718.1 ATP-binding protein [Coraliomargarita sp. SDUM461003]
MRHSFKFKIALTSLLVTGTLLVSFGGLFFASAYHTGIDGMDQEIRTLAESSLRGSRPHNFWQNFEKSLQFIYGDDADGRMALLVVNGAQQVSFQSDNAPAELIKLAEGVLEQPLVLSEEKMVRPIGSGIIRRLDRDQDGVISLQEFDGPVVEFELLDSDQDGWLNSEELAPLAEARLPPRRREPPVIVEAGFKTLYSKSQSGNWRVGLFISDHQTVVLAMNMQVFYRDLNSLRTVFFLAVPIGLILLSFVGWFLADRAMRPVSIIADTAEGITAKGLDRRIPMVGRDIELQRLVSVFNQMLDRLEKGYQQAVRFSADAAHELQTPLTILQGELDNAIQSAEAGSQEQQRYGMLMEELSHLKSVVQKLLLLAHADEGRLKLNSQRLELSELIRSAAEDLEVMAPALQVDIFLIEPSFVCGDLALLNQAVRNMISNAAKYTVSGGAVCFRLERQGTQLCFTLTNTAPPIPEEDCPLLFKRFHRVEKSRTTAGSGLGLSLAREIARAHEGDLILNDYCQGQVSFSLILPASEAV